MLLSPAERILLLNILAPAEGNALTLRSARSLRKAISFSEREIIDWEITSPAPGTFNWGAAAESVDIEITPVARCYVEDCLRAADRAGRLHEGLLDVFNQFFPEE